MDDAEAVRARANVARKVFAARQAIKAGRVHVAPEQRQLADELMNCPVGLLGLVDIRKLSPEALAFAKSIGFAFSHMDQGEGTEGLGDISIQDGQIELFRHFTHLFVALTGVAPEENLAEDQIRNHMLALIGGGNQGQWFSQMIGTVNELAGFYQRYRLTLFQQASRLGGVKFVVGGQRTFGPSALRGVRVSGLCADTQLIPDPVYPYLSADLSLNALHLQLALTLYYLLKLKPLVEARLPVPPIYVFPSFEEDLEARDAATMVGLNDLVVRVVGEVCEGPYSSVEELFEYAKLHEARFVDAISRERLFVPPGGNSEAVVSPREAARLYLASLEGIRDRGILDDMKRLPLGVLLLNGIMERLRPQFHLLDNADALAAQPLLTQDIHWYYFEKCAAASARALVRQTVLSEQAYAGLRALQDDSLTWLANIPVEGLVELHRNLEHQYFRDELKKYTSQLAAAGPVEIDAAVREVSTGLGYLLSKQEKELRSIEDRYSPKKWGVFAGGTLGVVAAASTVWLPSLAPALGVTVPTAAIAGAAIGIAKEKVGELVEKKRASRTLLGMLASARTAK